MMTSENYTTPKKYKIEGTTDCLYDKENNITDTTAYLDDSTAIACETTDISSTENANESSSSRRSRPRRSRDQISDESSRNSEEIQLEGATAAVEKPKSLKKEKPSGKKRKERKNLREKRRSTGVVIMPGAAVSDIVCLRLYLGFDLRNSSIFISCI
jgi:predicted RNA-binding protein